jgi:hypothetical protein
MERDYSEAREALDRQNEAVGPGSRGSKSKRVLAGLWAGSALRCLKFVEQKQTGGEIFKSVLGV